MSEMVRCVQSALPPHSRLVELLFTTGEVAFAEPDDVAIIANDVCGSFLTLREGGAPPEFEGVPPEKVRKVRSMIRPIPVMVDKYDSPDTVFFLNAADADPGELGYLCGLLSDINGFAVIYCTDSDDCQRLSGGVWRPPLWSNQ